MPRNEQTRQAKGAVTLTIAPPPLIGCALTCNDAACAAMFCAVEFVTVLPPPFPFPPLAGVSSPFPMTEPPEAGVDEEDEPDPGVARVNAAPGVPNATPPLLLLAKGVGRDLRMASVPGDT